MKGKPVSETPTSDNWNRRIITLEKIARLNELASQYVKEDKNDLLQITLVQLAQAHFSLYELNKEFDEEVAACINLLDFAPMKSFRQKIQFWK